MMKFFQQLPYKYKMITGGMLLIIIVAFSFWFFRAKQPEVWDFIPDSMILTIESQNIIQNYTFLKKQDFLNSFSSAEIVGDLLKKVDFLAKKTSQDIDFQQLLQQKKMYLSIHLISRESLGGIFYLPLSNEKETFRKFVQKFQQDPTFQPSMRMYQNFQINEIRVNNKEEVFSFFIYNDFFVGSYSAVLLEDVIRKINEGHDRFRLTRNKRTQDDIQKLKSENFVLYVNPRRIPDFMAMHSAGKLAYFFKPLENFAETAFFNFQFSKEMLTLLGYGFVEENNSAHFLNVFREQQAQVFSLKSYIPNQTAALVHLTFHDNEKFIKDLHRYYDHQNNQFLSDLAACQSYYNIDINSFLQTLSQEIAFAISDKNDKFLILKTTPQAFEMLKQFAQKAQNTEKKGSNKVFAGKTILEIPIKEFPATILGGLFQGYSTCFAVQVGDCIIMANREQAMNSLLEAMRNGEMWHKTHKNKNFMQKLSQKANFSLFVQTEKIWDVFLQNASQEWQDLMTRYSAEMQHVQYFTLQINRAESYFSTSIHLIFPSENIATNSTDNYKNIYNNSFKTQLHTSPWVVRNLIDKKYEIALQDYNNNVYLIADPNGQIIMERNVGGAIQGDIFFTDIYKNNKYQLAFATPQRIYLIDRLGRNIEGFPLPAPQGANIRHLIAIDFEKNKNYNFLITNSLGQLYMYDSKGQFMKGWQTARLGVEAAFAPKALRHQGKYYIAALTQTGRIFLYDREGNLIKGFPLQVIAGKVSNPLWLNYNRQDDNTSLIALTENGQMTEVNTRGEVLKVQSFKRKYGDSKFLLFGNEALNEWFVAEKDETRVAIYDKNGDLLIEKGFSAEGKIILQYFSIEEYGKIVAITHEKEAQTYLFDLKGNPLASSLKSTKAIDIKPDVISQKLMIYRVFRNTFSTFLMN
ncbi:MAG: hypothetical protein EAZ55_11940 [Cytophagales bacterium]|nr:MAG: hypothetical protein EAZ55_11940 [Cytophagales bacterium]